MIKKRILIGFLVAEIGAISHADTLDWVHLSNGIPGDVGNYGDFYTASNWDNQTTSDSPALAAPTNGDSLIFNGAGANRLSYGQSLTTNLSNLSATSGQTDFRFAGSNATLNFSSGISLSGSATSFDFTGYAVQYLYPDLTRMSVTGGINIGQTAGDDASLSFSKINVTADSVDVGSASGATGQLTIGQEDDTAQLTVNGTLTVHAGSTLHQKYARTGEGLVVDSLDLGGDASRLVWDSGKITLANSGLTVGAGGLVGSTVVITNDGIERQLGNKTYNYLTSKTLSLSGDLVIEDGGSLTVESKRSVSNTWFHNLVSSQVMTSTNVVMEGNSQITLNAWSELYADGTIDLGTAGELTLAHEGARVRATSISASGGNFNWLAGTVRWTDSASPFEIGASGPLGDNVNLTGTYDASGAPNTPGSRSLQLANTNAVVANGGTLNIGQANSMHSQGMTVQDGGSVTLSGDVSGLATLGYRDSETTLTTLRDEAYNTYSVPSESTTTMGAISAGDLVIESGGSFNISGGHLVLDSIDAQAGSSVTWNSGALDFRVGQTLDSNFILGESVVVGLNQILSTYLTADDTTDSVEVDGGHLHLRGASGFAEGKLILTSGTLEYSSGLAPLYVGAGEMLGQDLTLGNNQRLLTDSGGEFQVKNGGSLTLDGGELQTFTTDLVEAGGSFTFNSGRLVMLGEDLFIGSGGLLGSSLNLSSGKDLELEDRGVGETLYDSIGSNTGRVTVDNGATLMITGGSLKADEIGINSGGTLTLTGGSLTTNSLTTPGAITVDGASVYLNEFSNDVTLNSGLFTATSTSGKVTMNGGALNVTNLNGGLEYNGGSLSGTPSISNGLEIASAGSLSFTNLAGGLIQNNASSTVNVYGTLSGGVQLTAGSLDASSISGNIIQGAGMIEVGALTGDATINGGTFQALSVSGTVTNNGGIVAPGASPAISTFGSYEQDGSATLEMEIGGRVPGSSGYDQLIITGDATLAGTLEIILIDLGGGQYEPQEGDTFALFDFQGNVNGWFDTVNLPTLTEGLAWDTSNLELSGELGVELGVVPEPRTYALILGIVMLLASQTRRGR